MLILLVLALVSVLAVAMAIRDVARDGYRRLPARPNGQEAVPRYR